MLTKRGLYSLRITGLVLTVLALLLLTLSFGTYGWLTYQVKKTETEVMSSPGYSAHPEIHYSRSRGLFQTCYEDNYDWLDKDKFASAKSGDSCLYEQGYHLDSYYKAVEMYGDDYRSHIHMLRGHWILFALSIFFLFLQLILTVKRLWKQYFSFKEFLLAPTIAFLQAIMIGVAMGLFHYYVSLENNEIDNDIPILPYYAFYGQNSTMYADVAVKGVYGYSYYLGWVGLAFSIIAALVLVNIAREIYIQDLRMSQTIDASPRTTGTIYRDEDTPEPGVIIPVNQSKLYCSSCGGHNKRALFPSTEPKYGCSTCGGKSGNVAEQYNPVWSSANTGYNITAEKEHVYYCATCGGKMSRNTLYAGRSDKLRCENCGGKKKMKETGMAQPMTLDYNQRNNNVGRFTFENPSWTTSY